MRIIITEGRSVGSKYLYLHGEHTPTNNPRLPALRQIQIPIGTEQGVWHDTEQRPTQKQLQCTYTLCVKKRSKHNRYTERTDIHVWRASQLRIIIRERGMGGRSQYQNLHGDHTPTNNPPPPACLTTDTNADWYRTGVMT